MKRSLGLWWVVVAFLAAGCRGEPGLQGSEGPPGPQGPAGVEGMAGLPGADGVSVTVATVEAGDLVCPNGGAQLNGVNGAVYACNGLQGPEGQPGAAGPAGPGIEGIYGDGSDGDLVLSANATLLKDSYYRDLTLNPYIRLNTGGFRLFVSGTLTLHPGAHIGRDGNHATAEDADGAALPPGTLGGGAAAEAAIPNSAGGHGVGFEFCGNVATPPPAEVGGAQVLRALPQALTGRALDGSRINGGAGGGSHSGCGDGVGSGGGGGVVLVAARNLVTVGGGALASITANGGAGFYDGNGTMGGQGGGGVVIVISATPKPTNLLLRAGGFGDEGQGTVVFLGP